MTAHPKAPFEFILSSLGGPLGDLELVADLQGRLISCEYADLEDRLLRLLDARFGPYGWGLTHGAAPPAAKDALDRYFSGELAALEEIPVAFHGSEFQEKVWKALRRIPPGSPASYGGLAAQIGRPGAARAVGSANHRNPLEIVAPCHRVVGASGALTGYAGGLERKRWLLEFEARHARALPKKLRA